jgi:hypothetical protein
MKVEELRIGNWVYNYKNKLVQIVRWSGGNAYYTDDNSLFSVGRSSSIPLSNGWFEKFNWKNGFHKGLLMRVGSQINLFGQIVPVNYVHELQNLYYALHKEEL